MKSVFTLSACAIALVGIGSVATASDAHADVYVKAAVGQTQDASVSGIDLTGKTAWAGAVGTGLGPLRIEGGVTHVSGSIGSFADVSAYDYNATAYLDVPLSSNTGVFAGIGADYVKGQATAFGSSMDADGKGWHWSAGVAHRFADGVIGEVSYVRTSADLDTPFGSVNTDYSTVMAGVRVRI